MFEKKDEEDEDLVSPSLSKSTSLPDRFDELPIELASSVDRFVESLGARVYSEPPTIDQLADIFQEFYVRASASISIHISALMSRLNRSPSPTPPSTATKSRPPSKKQGEDSLAPPEKSSGAQQMLTASEVTERRKARRLLEYKRILLEEAVERRICDKVYDKIWRHKSTLDEVRDEKLRSKTAALALVGIGLHDLGVEADSASEKTLEDVQESLTPARDGLARMTEEHCPLGKLQHLTTAHKAIVDTLYSIHPSSASADDILPTLIYALITSPVEGINAISNLSFIQRFRMAAKVDGEAAYCMTNLEAAISFLENVDLASLRADEVPEGPGKSTDSETTAIDEKTEAFPKLSITTPSPSVVTSSSSPSTATASTNETALTTTSKASLEKQMPPPQARHNRTLSDLVRPITNAPETVRSTAEESLKNISSTLDNSFKFFFGKLREQQQSSDADAEPIIPKTLDEARQLVSRPLTPEGDDAAISETSSLAGDSTTNTPPSGPASKLTQTEDKILSFIGGRRRTGSLIRDRSVDSQKSNASNSSNPKRVVFAATGSSSEIPTLSTAATPKPMPSQAQAQSSGSSSTNPLDSVKNFGATINPISHLSNISNPFAFRPFGGGRTASPIIPPTPTSTPANMNTAKHLNSSSSTSYANTNTSSGMSMSVNNIPEISLRPPLPHEILEIKSQPPNPRFLALEDVNELRLGEVQDLLRDYQRIARVLEGLRVVGEEEAGMA